MLLRLYTQNIDGLEFLAGIPAEKLVECHGHFRTATCCRCHKAAPDPQLVKDTIVKEGKVPQCTFCNKGNHRQKNLGSIKPDIVFFGEALPDRFSSLLEKDVKEADLLLVMGTSLQVAPVNTIPNLVSCPRVLFNREKVLPPRRMTTRSSNSEQAEDLFVGGDCDNNVVEVCRCLLYTSPSPRD